MEKHPILNQGTSEECGKLKEVLEHLDNLEKFFDMPIRKKEIRDIIDYIKKNGNKYHVLKIEFEKDFQKIQDYRIKFLNCKENGFSNELCRRVQLFEFENEGQLQDEINLLKSLMHIYDWKKFPAETDLITKLILDLEDFKPKLRKFIIGIDELRQCEDIDMNDLSGFKHGPNS